MSMYTLKAIAKRASSMGAAVAMLTAAIIPSVPVFADALNPLTDRSLTLSSSSPGWDYKDGSGNALYAPPNSGANGQKTGNTFDFKVSTDTTPSGTNQPVKAITFQYCMQSAGDCLAPGNIPFVGSVGSATRDVNGAAAIAAKTSDLEVVKDAGATEVNNSSSNVVNTSTGLATSLPNRDGSQGNWIVYYDNAGTWTQSTGWDMTVSEKQTVGGVAGSVADKTSTGTDNFITLKKTAGQPLAAGTQVKVIFFATDDTYITNPGAGAFFVKINTYKDDTTLTDANLVDGGVTVANVMNLSINIQTKVLETMDFSVGVVDPYTLDSTDTDGATPGVQSQLKTANGNDTHGQCDRILTGMTQNPTTPNTLLMGDQTAENSLRTDKTYSTHSYWRLSSNSSAGATVYYSGNTLANTVNDTINAIGTNPSAPLRGTPQFGLALANGTNAANTTVGPYTLDYAKEDNSTTGLYENGADNGTAGVHSSVATDIAAQNLAGYHAPKLFPLIPNAAYDQGAGNVNSEYGSVNTQFAFDNNSTYIPAALASENDDVVDCVTAKMRYIANIAATTPAGIYTTKINYIAAPQY